MCGIFSYLKSDKTMVDIQTREKIARLLHHRGPDHWGFWEDERNFFLQTRLKIIDLEERANQPFHSENKRYILLYNGECYNFRSLRQELEGFGYHFKTSSDTEVILNAFIQWGIDFIQRVAGMFSLVIHDRETSETFIWRDRLGIKPLYYSELQNGTIFSSEIKPILLFRKAVLNDEALGSYFNLRYVAGNSTFFKDVTEVPPGGFLLCRYGKIISKKSYWDCRKIIPDSSNDISPEIFFDQFKKVVAEHNIADVNVGCFLSGGVDSASLAAVSSAKGFFPEAYTLSTGLKNDEKDKANQIAKVLGLNHSTLTISDSSFDLFKKALWHLEDPIGDSIIVPTLLLAEGAAKKHKVVLSGEGADEIFSSYIHHHFLNIENVLLQKIPQSLWPILGKVARLVPLQLAEAIFPYPSRLGSSGWEKVKVHLNQLDDPFQRYTSLVGLFSGTNEKIFNHELQLPLELKDFWDSMESYSFSDKLKRFDLYFWGRNYTLHRLDRLTMASSLEGRVPFFDHRLVEMILSIPSEKMSGLRDPKMFFRRSLSKSSLPAQVINRRKQAFYLPLEKVFHGSFLQKAKQEIMDNSAKRGIYNKKFLEDFLFKKNAELLDGKQLQVLYNFELWCQLFLDHNET